MEISMDGARVRPVALPLCSAVQSAPHESLFCKAWPFGGVGPDQPFHLEVAGAANGRMVVTREGAIP